MIGQTLGSYKILSELGAGGMGVVYAAEHELIGRQAAVKLLLPELSSNKQLVDRFFNEARAAAVVKHPGIVGIFDFGYTDEGAAYLIMELLDGECLADRIERGRLDEPDVLRIGRQVASTLGAVHEAGIIHRDLKPDNVFLVPDSEVRGGERAKILDFGIAKLSEHRAPGTSKTQTGQVMGSPLYMSPEQCRGAGEVDARADVYSLGCILYEMACGQPLFDGEGVGEVLGKQIYETPPPPRQVAPDISVELETIILRALAKEPDDRYQSMDEVVAALDAVSDEEPESSRTAKIHNEESLADTALPGDATRPKVRTTLGRAVSAKSTATDDEPAPAPSKRRTGLWVAAALLAVGGAVYATTSSFGLRIGPHATPEPTAAATATAAPPATAPSESATGAGTAESDDATADQVTIAIQSTPPGAAVLRIRGDRRERLGVTPFRERFERADADLNLRLELEGHQPLELPIALDEDYDKHFDLVRKPFGALPAPPPPPAAPKPSAAPTATPATPEPAAPTAAQPTQPKDRQWGQPLPPEGL